MSAETRFLFETDFSDAEALDRAEPNYNEADLEAARQEALEAARAELRGFEETRAAELLATMAIKLDAIAAQRDTDLQTASESAASIAVAICRKVLPTLAEQNKLAEIEGHVTRTLANVHGEPRVVIRVAEQNMPLLQPGIDKLAGPFQGEIVLMGDDQLSVTDCQVMWADGGSDRDVARTWAEIDASVAQISAEGIAAQPAGHTPQPNPSSTNVVEEISNNNNELENSPQVTD